ncbi:conserved hypothetical protein [Crenothrix polyspora]|uniref:Uncharacterized protein n=1 Tax=Crenothrix polyspora TaxID=360316 RepID=A0A1R4H8Z5_9GAMM|nr:conserved hypothetical protein [Crenothrix polyspora]
MKHADRLERLILIMVLAMHWCVRIGQDNAFYYPNAPEKNEKTKRPTALEFQKT